MNIVSRYSAQLVAVVLFPTLGGSTEGNRPAGPPQQAASGCDAAMRSHVYSPKRLKQLAPCVVVSGTVEESKADEDGDQHFLLRVDPKQLGMVNKRNWKKKGGALVVEIVCANPTQQRKAQAACAGYTNRIPIPKAGDRVRVTGTYVLDSHNGWNEVHPVSRLEKL
jgi:hypothetical protein